MPTLEEMMKISERLKERYKDVPDCAVMPKSVYEHLKRQTKPDLSISPHALSNLWIYHYNSPNERAELIEGLEKAGKKILEVFHDGKTRKLWQAKQNPPSSSG